MKGTVTKVYKELKERANKVGLSMRIKKTKAMVQNRRTKRMSKILTTKDNNIEVITSIK
jgi:hypothetical protein